MKTNITEKTGFTLIEMLAVLFIIGIVFSIALPAIGPISSTMSINTAADNLASTLEAARQYAITSGVSCYVVFPTTTGNADMDYKAYKIFNPDRSTTVGKWEYLPKTVEIYSGRSFIDNPPDDSININFPEDTSPGQENITHYVEFKKNGSATLTRTIRLIDMNNDSIFKEIVFYNQPIQIKVRDLGET